MVYFGHSMSHSLLTTCNWDRLTALYSSIGRRAAKGGAGSTLTNLSEFTGCVWPAVKHVGVSFFRGSPFGRILREFTKKPNLFGGSSFFETTDLLCFRGSIF